MVRILYVSFHAFRPILVSRSFRTHSTLSPSGTVGGTSSIRRYDGVERANDVVVSSPKQAVTMIKTLDIFGASKLYQIALSKGLVDAFVITSFVLCCRRHQQPQRALRVWQDVSSLRIKPDRVLVNAFIAAVGDCRDASKLGAAFLALSSLPSPSITSYLSLIEACRKCGEPRRALDCNRSALSAILRHDHVATDAREITLLFGSVASAAVECGDLQSARMLLRAALEGVARPLQSGICAQLLKVFCSQKELDDALQLLNLMTKDCVSTSLAHYSILVKGCINASNARAGCTVHAHLRASTLPLDSWMFSLLQRMYISFGNMRQAEDIFADACQLKKVDIIGCFEMVKGYVAAGRVNEAVTFALQTMRSLNVQPDGPIFSTLLAAVGKLRSLPLTKRLHSSLSALTQSNSLVITSLMHAYIQAGDLDAALKIMRQSMDSLSVEAWTVIIGGWGQHGRGELAMDAFASMIQAGKKPDAITCLNVIHACSHSGMVQLAQGVFEYMASSLRIQPDDRHFTALADAYARAGSLSMAKQIVLSMPRATPAAWMSILGAARNTLDVETAEFALSQMENLDSHNIDGLAAAYVLMCTIYRRVGRVADASRVRFQIEERGLLKVPGVSSIEVGTTRHSFKCADADHPDIAEINLANEDLHQKLALLPASQLELDMIASDRIASRPAESDELKKKLSVFHSERLAIAYGLLRIPGNETIRIYKNLRVCTDCHEITKLISRHTGRDIIVSDANRFHHFSSGVCSCGDYW